MATTRGAPPRAAQPEHEFDFLFEYVLQFLNVRAAPRGGRLRVRESAEVADGGRCRVKEPSRAVAPRRARCGRLRSTRSSTRTASCSTMRRRMHTGTSTCTRCAPLADGREFQPLVLRVRRTCVHDPQKFTALVEQLLAQHLSTIGAGAPSEGADRPQAAHAQA
jgi:hypothetical protein